MADNEPIEAVIGRVRRINSGESHRRVYGFEDEKMDECMYRLMENCHVSDLTRLADAFLASLPPGPEG